jgi:hypothetical protein
MNFATSAVFPNWQGETVREKKERSDRNIIKAQTQAASLRKKDSESSSRVVAPQGYTVEYPDSSDQITLYQPRSAPLPIVPIPPVGDRSELLNKIVTAGLPIVKDIGTWGYKKLYQYYSNQMVKRRTIQPRTSRPTRGPSRTQVPRTTAPLRGRNIVLAGQQVGNSFAPVSRSVRVGAAKAKATVRNLQDGAISVAHTEMVGTLVSSGTVSTYSVSSFVANPGKPSIFPWLSTLATNYDMYRFKKLRVCLVSSQPTSVGGRIGIGFDYDSTDPTPRNRVEFFALSAHIESSPWESLELNIPCEGGKRFTNTHTTSDSKLIDLGQILLMSDQIITANSVLADIIVSYEVELFHPQQAIFNTQGFTSLVDSGTSATGPSFVTISAPVTTNSVTITFPQGTWLVSIIARDSAAGIAPALLNSTVFSALPAGEQNHSQSISTQYMEITRFTVTTSSLTMTLSLSTLNILLALGTLNFRMWISRMSPAIAF